MVTVQRPYKVVIVNQHDGKEQPMYDINGEIAGFSYEEAKVECKLFNHKNPKNCCAKVKRVY